MARNVLKSPLILVVVVVLFAISGCSRSSSIVEILRGNLAYSRGDYQNSLVHYMVAAGDDPRDAWTRFNIGTVYFALGEIEAAIAVWDDARTMVDLSENRSSDLSLIFAASYNRGVLLYQQGAYQEAYDEFRYALSINSGSTQAKANLELALAKLLATESTDDGAVGTAGGIVPDPVDPAGESDEQTLRILEYVRRKETQRWFANQEITSQDQEQDW